jgi:hypothetical protein
MPDHLVTHIDQPATAILYARPAHRRAKRRAPAIEPAPADVEVPFDPIAGLLEKAREVAGE